MANGLDEEPPLPPQPTSGRSSSVSLIGVSKEIPIAWLICCHCMMRVTTCQRATLVIYYMPVFPDISLLSVWLFVMPCECRIKNVRSGPTKSPP